MTVETATYISDLNTANPGASDLKAEGDDHLRLIKTTVKATFPAVTGAVTPTHTELNFVDGVTSAIQNQIDTKAPKDSPTFTGTVTAAAVTTTGNTILGNAQADTLNVGNGDIVKDASGNVGLGGSSAGGALEIIRASGDPYIRITNGTVQAYMQASNGSSVVVFGSLSNHPVSLFTNSATRLTVTADGRFYGASLHNNAGSVAGATNQYIASGTYTPTVTGVTNYTSSTPRAAQWVRVGNVVTVSAQIDVTTTAASAQATIGVSLPIASSLANSWELVGTMVQTSVAGTAYPVGTVNADATNDRANVDWTTTSSGVARTMTLTFTYVVL